MESATNRTRRRGAAAVELAACMPIIVMLVLGSLEACGMIFLKQTLAAASYEGIREAVRPNATTSSVQSKCQEVLDNRGVNGSAITITVISVPVLDFDNTAPSPPPPFADAIKGDPIEVTVSAPSSLNRMIVTRFLRNININASAVMLKE